MSKKLQKTQSDQWMEAGFKEADKVEKTFNSLKSQIVNAGYFFLRAKNALPEGVSVEGYLERWKNRMGKSSIYNYMTFTEEVMAWAVSEYPELAGHTQKLLAAGKKLALQSPKSFTALLRDLKLMRQFGEYDEVKYNRKKLQAGEQMEFGFDVVLESAKVLHGLNLDTVLATVPEGMDQREAIGQVVASLRAAEARLSAWLNDAPLDVEMIEQTAPLALPAPGQSPDSPFPSNTEVLAESLQAKGPSILNLTTKGKKL